MKLKKIIGALALIGASACTFAADQSVSMTSFAPGFYTANYSSAGFAFDGGSDVLSLTGLAAGKYNLTFVFNGWNTLLNEALTTSTNGFSKLSSGTFGTIEQYTFVATKNSPITVELFGAAATGGLYFGNVTASLAPVPEPESYAMLLAGLGIMGAVARRRAAK